MHRSVDIHKAPQSLQRVTCSTSLPPSRVPDCFFRMSKTSPDPDHAVKCATIQRHSVCYACVATVWILCSQPSQQCGNQDRDNRTDSNHRQLNKTPRHEDCFPFLLLFFGKINEGFLVHPPRRSSFYQKVLQPRAVTYGYGTPASACQRRHVTCPAFLPPIPPCVQASAVA